MAKSAGRPKERPKKNDKPKGRQAPGRTVDSRENELINLAVNQAAKQIRAGTASSQVITHFLKLGSTQMRLEKEKLTLEKDLLQAKTEALKSQKKVEELYANALEAMKSYTSKD